MKKLVYILFEQFISKFLEYIFIKIKIHHVEGWRKRKIDYEIENEGIRVDSASPAENISEINRNVIPTEITHNYTVKGTELICDYHYQGNVCKNNVEGLIYTFSSTNQQELDESQIYYSESGTNRKFKPILIGSGGLAKKYLAKFDKMKNKGSTYDMNFHINLGKCVNQKREYILSHLKYAKEKINKYNVTIQFEDGIPNEIRVYELKKGKYKYCRRLEPIENKFIDNVKEIKSVASRVYIFDREEKDDNS